MKLKKVIAAVTAAAVAIGSFTAYSIVSPKFSLSAEMEPEIGRIIVDTAEDSGLAFAFYNRAEDASGEPIKPIEDETNKYAVEANTEILAVVTLPENLEDGKKLSVFYGEEKESFFENDKTTFSFSFTMPEEGIVVGAEIKDLDIYNITATVEDSGMGSVTINGQDAGEGVQAAENSEVTVVAEPAEGYEVGSIMVITDRETFGIDSGDSFVMPSGDVTIEVQFEVKMIEAPFGICFETFIPGNVTATVNDIVVAKNDISDIVINEGEIVTLNIEMNKGYSLSEIFAYYYTYEYEDIEESEVIAGGDIGVLLPSVPHETKHYIDLTPTQDDKNVFTFVMPAYFIHIELSYSFSGEYADYSVNITPTENGEIKVVTNPSNKYAEVNDGDSVRAGSDIYVIPIPNEEYKIDKIIITDDEGNEIRARNGMFYMPECGVTITVTFVERDQDANTCTVTIIPTENGKASVNYNIAEFSETVTLSCFPSDGYSISEIIVIEDETNSSYYFGREKITHLFITSNITVIVNFVKLHNINTTSNYFGSISVVGSDNGLAIKGTEITISSVPDDGYVVEDISVTDNDGNVVDITIEGNQGIFTMPDSDVTVTVTFKEVEPEVIDPDEPNPEETSSDTEAPDPEVTSTETEAPTPEATSSDTEAPAPEVTSSDTETPTPEVTPSETETPAPEITPSETETPTPEVTSSETETPTPEVTSSETETPTPEVTSSDTEPPAPEITSSNIEPPAPEETTPATETPDPDTGDTSENLTIDIDEENKITGNNVIQVGGDVKPGETVDITDENSDASASVKLPDNAESGLSFIITNKTDEIIDSANKILAEAAKTAAEKAKAIKSTIENILNNKDKGFAYEIKFTDGRGNTVKVEGSFVKAALPIPENLLPKNNTAASFFVYHAAANGLEKIDSIFNAANNTVEFAATSFSPYFITLEEITGGALASDENGGTEPEGTALTSRPGFVIPALTVSSTEANATGSVTAAPIPAASSTTTALTTVPPDASDAPAATLEANAAPIDGANNTAGKPDSENAAYTTRNSSTTSGMGFADTNAMTGLALELVPLLAVTAIGVLVSMKKK